MDRVYRMMREAKAAEANGGNFKPTNGEDKTAADGDEQKREGLSDTEKHFLQAVDRGDIERTRRYVEFSKRGRLPDFNINCIDPLGRSALLIAIDNENIEIIELLLTARVELGDALLHAIDEENVEAVELLLKAHQQQSGKKDLRGFFGPADGAQPGTTIPAPPHPDSTIPASSPIGPSSSFAADMTPIILAAQRNNYEIVKILLDRGDNIPRPHDVRCSCDVCVQRASDDSLRHSRSRINAYRALASPSLIALSSRDPILTAFELSEELRRLSRLENEFMDEYQKLAKQCQDFAVELLDQTRGSKELETILNYDSESIASIKLATERVSDTSDERMRLSRLKLAIKFKQKRFVAHAHCQQLLASLWFDGLPGFRRRNIVFQLMLAVTVSGSFPILSILYIFFPCSSWVCHFMRRPFIRFLCHLSSYLSFVLLLILSSQPIDALTRLDDGRQSREVHGAPPTYLEWVILVFVLGQTWQETKRLWNQGMRNYIQDMWNIVEFTTNGMYITTYTLKFVAYFKFREELADDDPYAGLPRAYWNAYDPGLMAEALFSAANILSILKLIHYFTISSHLGPLQLTLGRMVNDVMRFMMIAVLVIFAFSCGVNQLYWFYSSSSIQACESTCNTTGTPFDCDCDRSLANLFEIVQTLYFAVYGLTSLDTFAIKQRHSLTQFVGKLIFGTYAGCMIIVLINMLIAMLTRAYETISNNADTEWKFARSKLWMSYFQDGGTVPPPFNLIPTPKTFWHAWLWVVDKICGCSPKLKENKWLSVRKYMKKASERQTQYQFVMNDLVKRYVTMTQKREHDEGVTEDDVNEIKHDISSFRYELLDVLRTNGMKMASTSSRRHSSRRGAKMRQRNNMASVSRILDQIQTGSQQDESGADGDVIENGTDSASTSVTTVASVCNGDVTNCGGLDNGAFVVSIESLPGDEPEMENVNGGLEIASPSPPTHGKRVLFQEQLEMEKLDGVAVAISPNELAVELENINLESAGETDSRSKAGKFFGRAKGRRKTARRK